MKKNIESIRLHYFWIKIHLNENSFCTWWGKHLSFQIGRPKIPVFQQPKAAQIIYASQLFWILLLNFTILSNGNLCISSTDNLLVSICNLIYFLKHTIFISWVSLVLIRYFRNIMCVMVSLWMKGMVHNITMVRILWIDIFGNKIKNTSNSNKRKRHQWYSLRVLQNQAVIGIKTTN